jgi:phytoene/squalene synthetase
MTSAWWVVAVVLLAASIAASVWLIYATVMGVARIVRHAKRDNQWYNKSNGSQGNRRRDDPG